MPRIYKISKIPSFECNYSTDTHCSKLNFLTSTNSFRKGIKKCKILDFRTDGKS